MSGTKLLRTFAPLAFGLAGLGILTIAITTQKFNEYDPAVQTAGLSLLGIAFGAVVACLASSRPIAWLTRFLENRGLQWFGRISYGLYFDHGIIVMAIESNSAEDVLGGRDAWSQLARCVIYFVSTIVMSYLSWHLLEYRILAFKDRFTFDTAPQMPGRVDPRPAPALPTLVRVAH